MRPVANRILNYTNCFFPVVDLAVLLDLVAILLVVSFLALMVAMSLLKSNNSSFVHGSDCTVKSTFFGSLISPILL